MLFVSCGSGPVVEPDDNNSDKTEGNNTTEKENPKAEKPSNKTDDSKDKPVKPEVKPDKKHPPKDEFTPLFDFTLIKSEDPKHLAFQTEHAYVDVSFSEKNSILDFYTDELAEMGKKHLVKKCVDYV